MADCLSACESYSPALKTDQWNLLTSGYNPMKDKIQLIHRKSIMSERPFYDRNKTKDFMVIPTPVVLKLVDENLLLDEQLGQLAGLIERSKYMLSMDSGWDEENALAIDPEIWKVAVKFLIQCATDIFENHDRIIDEPEINPCKDGTVDLSWRTSNVRLLINFRKAEEGIRAYYYGDFYQNEQPIKGWVNADSTDNFLSMWMKNLAE